MISAITIILAIPLTIGKAKRLVLWMYSILT